MGEHITQLGANVNFQGDMDPTVLRFLAETESKNAGELSEILQMLRQRGYLAGDFFGGGGAIARPTAAGWAEIDKLSQPLTDSSQAFVAMWFHESTNDAYVKGIAPALSATGYKPLRIDRKEHNNKIDMKSLLRFEGQDLSSLISLVNLRTCEEVYITKRVSREA